MGRVQNKTELKAIAKRFAKGVLESATDSEAFIGTELSEEEVEYIWAQVRRIANRITEDPAGISTPDLVDEYYVPVATTSRDAIIQSRYQP